MDLSYFGLRKMKKSHYKLPTYKKSILTYSTPNQVKVFHKDKYYKRPKIS
jgi:hypothetical protein